MKKKLYTLAFVALLFAGCTIVTPQEQTEITSQQQAEPIHETGADVTKLNSEQNIVERLLPTGFIEIGDRNAPIVLMMFTEHHCRYCKDFFMDDFPKLYKEFINQGTVRLQIGILPLHKYVDSEAAAITLLCGAMQERGIPMHKLLFELGAKDKDVQMSLAQTLELDTALFTQCLDSPDTARTVEREKSFARSLDVTLVPTFFLNGEKSVGLPDYVDLRSMIEKKLQ